MVVFVVFVVALRPRRRVMSVGFVVRVTVALERRGILMDEGGVVDVSGGLLVVGEGGV